MLTWIFILPANFCLTTTTDNIILYATTMQWTIVYRAIEQINILTHYTALTDYRALEQMNIWYY